MSGSLLSVGLMWLGEVKIKMYVLGVHPYAAWFREISYLKLKRVHRWNIIRILKDFLEFVFALACILLLLPYSVYI